jgi:hypothetical protein
MSQQLVFERDAGEVRSGFKVSGVRVHGAQIPDVIAWMEHSIVTRSAGHSIAFTGVHGMTECPAGRGVQAS